MPIKFTFEDRNSRIHFEKTMKSKCGIQVIPSLPKPIRNLIATRGKELMESDPDSMFILRTCAQTLSIIVLKKEMESGTGTGGGWKRIDSIRIDPSVMVRNRGDPGVDEGMSVA